MKKLAVITFLIFAYANSNLKAQQTLEIADSFTQLELKGPMRVELIPSDEYKTIITLYGIEQNRLSWKAKGSQLSLQLRSGYLDRNSYAEVKVHYKNIEKLSCEGATITTSDAIVSDKFMLETLGGVNKIQLNVEVEDLQVNTAGKSDILIIGSARWADLRAILGSRIDCMQMNINDVLAISNQGSEIYVNVLQRLDARVNSGGNVYYLGNPRLKTKKTLGGGVVSVETPKAIGQSTQEVAYGDDEEDQDI